MPVLRWRREQARHGVCRMVVLRLTTIEDAASTGRVHALSWKSAYRGIVPDDFLDAIDVEAWVKRHRRNMAEDPEDFVSYVAETDGEIMGWALAGPNRDTTLNFSGELFTIYLLPDRLRQGIGRKLIHAVAKSLIDGGHSSMIVWVLAENWPARGFYEALGGAYVSERDITIGGRSLMEVSYGWRNLEELLGATGQLRTGV